jgi:hypothetical protein
MFVTTLLSYRLLERIASAKLQAIVFSSSGRTRNVRLSRCSDPEPYPRKRRCGVEDNVAALFINTSRLSHPQLFPEERKIYANWSFAPLAIKILKHRGTRRLIPNANRPHHLCNYSVAVAL